MSTACPPDACARCPSSRVALERLGIHMEGWDFVVALAGNPNTGKSTVFNRLTGLRQHTGNWPGKTVSRAEGGFLLENRRYKLVDLPGTYSLLSASPDEKIARDFVLFGRPDVVVIVADASSLERNLNLALQVLQITDRAVLCLNLMDEAAAHGVDVDVRGLAADLGIPVVPCAAREGRGIPDLIHAIRDVATGGFRCSPPRFSPEIPGLREAVGVVAASLLERYPGLPHADWIALQLLDGDATLAEAAADGTLGSLAQDSNASLLATTP